MGLSAQDRDLCLQHSFKIPYVFLILSCTNFEQKIVWNNDDFTYIFLFFRLRGAGLPPGSDPGRPPVGADGRPAQGGAPLRGLPLRTAQTGHGGDAEGQGGQEAAGRARAL